MYILYILYLFICICIYFKFIFCLFCFPVGYLLPKICITIFHNTTVNVYPLSPAIFTKFNPHQKTKCWFFAFTLLLLFFFHMFADFRVTNLGRNACPPFADWFQRRKYSADGRISHAILGPKKQQQ